MYDDLDSKGEKTVRVRHVKLEKGDNFTSHAISDNGKKWTADESGPSALEYFLSSMAHCQMAHYAEHCASKGIDLDSLTMDIDGTFTVSHPRSFEKIEYSVWIKSQEDVNRLRDVSQQAELDCFVTNTLKRACDVHGKVYINEALELEL